MNRTRFSSVFAVLALLLSASLASAATSPRLEMLTKELSLTAEQQEKIGPLLKQQQAARQKVMANAASAPNQEALKATADAMAKRYDAQIEGVLTGDQVAKYQALRETEMGAGASASTASAGAPASAPAKAEPRNMRLEMLTKELSLTEEQQQKIGPLLKQQQAARQKVMANAASAPNAEALKATADAMGKRYDAQIEGVLTGDQVATYKALREKEMGAGAAAPTASTGATAGKPAKAGPRNMRLEKLTEELSLTPQQQAQIGPIIKRKNRAMKKVVQNASGAESGEQLKAKKDAVSRSFEQRIEARLDDEQRQKYQALLESERQ